MKLGASDVLAHNERRRHLQLYARTAARRGGVRKVSTSHLFRYSDRPRRSVGERVSLAAFNHVIGVDSAEHTLDVEGSTTYDAIVRHTLPYGLLPTVTPELKGITVGGAIAGIGIESSCFRYGFVHDGVIEADVLLPDGDIVTSSADGVHQDLFAALPNSYGTLGYVLRAKIELIDAEPFVRVTSARCDSVTEFLDVMLASTRDEAVDFVDGLIHSDREMYVICGHFAPYATDTVDIYHREPYYKQACSLRECFLRTEDYIFRYEPDWFWNIPEGGMYSVFRKVAPRWLRRSEVYRRFSEYKAALVKAENCDEEQLIQDWEVPWSAARELIQCALENVDLGGKPWAAVPVCSRRRATLYPIEPKCLYYNLGCYCWTRKPVGKERFYYTKLLDRRCFELGGIKMLYSSTFLNEEEFDRIYNGATYQGLKAVYDPHGRAPTLYEKVSSRA